MTLLFALVGGTAGCGVLTTLRGLRRSRLREQATYRLPKARREGGPSRVEVLLALAAAGVAVIITRWPIAAPLAAAAVLGTRGLRQGSGRPTIERLEAVATWTEMLRDTLAGASGLTQALVTTAATAPGTLSGAVGSMAAKLSAGVPLESCLRELGAELADPAADMVVIALVMASRERAQRLGDLLGALAASIREEVGMRLAVEASRASSRAAVRMISGFSLALFAFMALFAHSYLAPYRSATGQLVLAVVGLLCGLGLWLMSVMVRPEPQPRLLLEAGEQP